MKKNLLQFCLLLLISSFSFAQQGKLADVNYRAGRAITTSVMHNNKSMLPVPTTTTSTCMSVNLPVPTGWTQSNYGTGTPIFANGFVNGPNIYGDKEKAMYFDLSANSNTLITQVYIGFDIAYTATPSKTLAVKVYEGTTGLVGAAIGTETITMGEIMTDVAANRYSLVIFSTPIAIASKKFFVSVDVSALQVATMPKDSLSILSNSNGQTTPSLIWEKQSDNLWYQYTTAGSWNLSASLLIHPFLTQAPLVSTFSTSSNTICAGQSVSYNSAGSTPGTYQWLFGAIGTPTAAGATASATYSTAGSYTTILIVSDACGSLDAVQSFITVNAKPTVSATPATTVVCSGSNITLNGGGASTYAWTGGATNGTSFAPANGNYTVTGTAANGCTNTAIASVTVNALPTVSVTSGAICNGNSFSITPSGANTFTISGGTFSVSPTTTSSYSVTGTSAQGCLSSNTAVSTVTVNNLPNVTANTTSTSICAGSNVTLTGGGATTYTWSNSVSDGVAFGPSSSNTYTVNGTDINGCQNSSTVAVNVNNLPVVTANTTSTSICVGSNVTLTGGGATTYTWDNSVVDAIAFAPVYSNTYTVIGLDGNGCQNSATVVVNVNNLPSVLANTTSTLVCTGDNVVLTGSGGALTYTWTNGVVDGVGFAASTTNTYTVNGTDVNGCVGSATVEIVVSTCTGINNVSSKNSTVLVFPNPNNGEFTIQSYKNDVVSVINELGQTVKIVELNTINNYSSNITQLQNGVYFIIGKTVKQKVVVTK